MAVLEKIRVKFGILITVLVALALLSFILDPTTLRNFAQMASNDNKVGEMAGKNISYKSFYEEFDRFSKLAEMSGQSVNDENAQQALRNTAWQEIFDQNIFLPAAEKAGVYVSDKEMYELTQGTNISPLLLQQGIFNDETGNFNRAALAQFVQSIDQDETGKSAMFWDFLESSIYKAQVYSKYYSLVQASVLQNKVEKARVVKENNTTADVDFVMVPAGFEPDTTIAVSREEIKAYYNDHKAQMKQLANRDIQYVMYEVVPSQEDINETKENFDQLYEEFKTADNLKNFIALNSDAKFDTRYYKESELQAVAPEFAAIFNAGNATSEVHTTEDSFAAARVADRASMCDSARVFYAVFPISEEAKADSLLNIVRAKGATEDMVELGWFTQEAANANGLGELTKILSTTEKAIKIKHTTYQAWFVVYAAERTKPVTKVQLATLVKNVLPSESTYRDFLMKATELSDKAQGKAKKFAEIAAEENLPIIPVKNLTEDTRRVGVCDNARELVRWVFDKKTKNGSVSDVIVVDNKYYFVACVDRIRKEGRIELIDVAKDIRTILATQKKVNMLKAETAEKIKGCNTIEEVAEALSTTVSHNAGVSFGSQYQQLDGKFVGAVANAAEGKLVGPVAGEVGVYVFSVSNVQNGSFFTDADAETSSLQKASYHANVLENVMSEAAGTKDYRARFF